MSNMFTKERKLWLSLYKIEEQANEYVMTGFILIWQGAEID